jgi:hypothetical protein
VCGNGIIEQGEQCDTTNLNGMTCTDLGFNSGTLKCNSYCQFDTSQCEYGPVCGNGIIEQGEECDTTNLNGMTCADFGNFTGGTLDCTSWCVYDFSGCTYPMCGDGICHSYLGENFENCPYDCEPSPDQTYLYINPRNNYVQAGDIFSVDVWVENAIDLYGFQFDISYDPTILEFYSGQEGGFFNDNGQLQNFCMNFPTASGFLDNIACSRLGLISGANGDGDLFSLTFRALASGTSQVAISNEKLSNQDAKVLPATVLPGEVVVR